MTERKSTGIHGRDLDWLAGLGLALAALGLYVWTLAPTVLQADAGEFQFVPWLPGIAHPTGYPFYVLLGWLWSHLLPLGDVAWRMNLLSAVLAAVTIGLTYAVARRLLDFALPETPPAARVLAAVIAAGLFAVSPTFWSQAIIAEVYALHALFVALLVWLALQVQQTDFDLDSGWAKLLTFAVGLSLTHHRTVVLLLPALGLFFVIGKVALRRCSGQAGEAGRQGNGGALRRNSGQAEGPKNAAVGPSSPVPERVFLLRPLSLLIHASLLIVPLLLYLYLPLVAPATPYATLTLSESQTLTLYENSLRGFWDHVMGTVFTGGLQPAAAGLDRFVLTWQLLRQQVGWLGVLLALIGLVVLWQRRRFGLLALTGLGLLGFVTFNLIYFIGDIFVLFIPAWFFVCLWIGIGLLALPHRVATWFVQRKMGPRETAVFETMHERLHGGMYRLLTVGFVVGFFVILIALLTMRNTIINQSQNFAAQERWQEILAEPIPPEAVLLSNDRNEIMPMWYFQYVEGRRPDLLGLFPLIVTDPAYATVGGVLDQALASNRPVYLIKPMAGLSLKADLVPEGSLVRATPIDPTPPQEQAAVLPEIAIEANPKRTEAIKLLGYGTTDSEITAGDEITVTLYWQPIQPLSIDYTSYVHLIGADGQRLTQNDHRPGGEFYPSSQWQVGEILRDRHTLNILTDAPAGTYRLRVGMYYQPEPGVIVGMGDGMEIGQVTVSP